MSLGSTLLRRLGRPVFLWAMAALIVELCLEYAEKGGLHPPLYLALFPIVPLLFFVLSLARMVSRLDELQRRICEQSAFLAFLLALVLTLVFAGLERAGIYLARWDDLGTSLLFLWGSAYVFFSWRYR